MKLQGKKVWLTGATSGIGLALSRELLKRGAILGISGRNAEKLQQIAASLSSSGGAITYKAADVSKLPEVLIAANHISQSLGGIDIAIANAGIHSETWPEEFNATEYLDIMNTNYGGMLNTFQSVIPQMVSRTSGTVVGVASVAGYRGLPRSAAYIASKSAMIHFLESIRFHLRRVGIKVVVVNPGFIRTPMTAKNDFKMPFLLSPEEAATRICDGLESERDTIAFPKLFALFLAFMRILPYPIYDFLVDFQWRRMERRKKLQ